MNSNFTFDSTSDENKQGEHVSRIKLKNENEYVIIDVHNVFFKFNNNNLNLKITKKCNLDNVDYINHGKIYNKKNGCTYISFGGLLMKINKLFDPSYKVGDDVYCYITFL